MKLNLRAFPSVAVVGLALVSVGWTSPGLVEQCGLDFWSVPDLQASIDESERQQDEKDVEDQRVLQRIEVKEGLITQLIDGRATIPEVAAQFKALNAGRKDYLALFHRQYPGASDDECYCRNVLAFAESRLYREGSRGEERAEMLRHELNRLIRGNVPFVLPDVTLTDFEPLAAGQ
jgi:hypothetical protein